MAAEYLDVVNEDNQVTGQASRQVIHASGWWHRGVHVFLFTPDGKLLVQKRGRAQDTYPGALDCSVSEHLKVGETYRAAALRGLREELGLPAIQLTRLLQFRMNYGPGDNMINELYKGILGGAALRINPQEIARIAYYTLPELEEMMRAGETPFSSWFVQLLRWYTGKPTTLQVLSSSRPLT
jgi:isopentenyl-diphosphate delta-isomerase type 1